MVLYVTEEELIARVERLTPVRLHRFVEARFVLPVDSSDGPVFRHLDCARLELLCELSDEFELRDDALDMVMALVDQLHGVRAELKTVLNVLDSEPDEVRLRLIRTIHAARAGHRS